MVLVLAMAAGGVLFASGDKEDDDVRYGNAPRGARQNWDGAACCDEDFVFEEVTLSGTVAFGAAGTTLTVDGEEWFLRYPMRALADVEIEAGDEVTVSGIISPGYRFYDEDAEEDGNYLMVHSAEIGGETYELFDDRDSYRGAMYGGNRRPGSKGSWGGGRRNW